MEIATIIASMKAATTSARKALDLSKTMQNLELKTTVAELMDALAESTMSLADLKADIAGLKEENATLKAEMASLHSKKQQQPKLKWGCYEFDDEEGLFCTACFETKGQKIPVSHLSGMKRQCPVCRAILS